PPSTILSIAKQTFTGLAVLFPVVIFGLYERMRSAKAAWTSMIVGEGLVVLYYFKLLPAFGFLTVVPVMLVTFAIYVLIALWDKRLTPAIPWFFKSPFFYAFLGIFALSMDFWRWHAAPRLILGFPGWLVYFIGLSVLQTGFTWMLIKRKGQAGSSGSN
ncbi:MAG: hypothetical protein GWP10_14825, partial [Nitrospiraceae bacterium]|nr:hypothetical protein [Nitrospiraceae bacterium]